MNYLSHARDSTHDPWLLAGVCLPDWLRVVHRRARVDPGLLDDLDPLGRGVRRHLDEDEWFHRSDAFLRLTRTIADRTRAHHPELRASFYAHITLEILLDAALMESHPKLLDEFYDRLHSLDADEVAARAGRYLRLPVEASSIARVIRFFRDARFLDGYQADEVVLARLRGVTSRVAKQGAGMAALPAAFVDTIAWARLEVRSAASELLESP